MKSDPLSVEAHLPVVTVNPSAHRGSPTAGIQEAIDSLPEGGGMVFVPHGTYLVRRSIVLRANVTLRGEAAATVLMRPAPIFFDLTAPTTAHCMDAELSTVEGLQVGDEIYIADKAQAGWHARHMTITAIKGTRVQGTLVVGDPERCYDSKGGAHGANYFPMILAPRIAGEGTGAGVMDLMVDGGPSTYDPRRMLDFTCSAIHGVHSDNFRVRGVTVRRWPGDGISTQGGSATVTECLVEDCLGNGYHPGTGISSSIWTNNISRRNGWDGFFFCLAVRNAIVSNNLLIDNHLNGIGGLQDPDAYNVITGNVIARNGKRGIDAFGALGNIIANNLIQDNSRSVPGAFAGLWMENHCGNVVTGNLCPDTKNAQKTPTQAGGIESIDPAGENTIANNAATLHTMPAAPPPPKAEIRPVEKAPVLKNGRLDDPAWKAADELVMALRAEDGTPAQTTTRARFLRDNRFLYIGLHCPEPFMDRISDCVTQHNGPTWSENSVEIYFMPDASGPRCFQLAINSLGTLLEQQYQGRKSSAWDSKAQVKAYRGQDFWSLEIAIPLEAFGPEGLPSGRQCKANVYRTRLTLWPEERSCWSPTMGGFFLPRRFGTLTVK